jgi:hypothetical protein
MDKEAFNETLKLLDEHIDWIEEHDPQGSYEFRVSTEFMTEALVQQHFCMPFATLDRHSLWYNGHPMVVDRKQDCHLQIIRKEPTPCS